MSCCITSLPAGEKGRIYNESPNGAYDCVNVHFTTANKFDPASIIIRLDGIALDPAQYTIGGDNQSFDLVVSPSNPKALNKAPLSEESLRVDYNGVSAMNCITFLGGC